MWRVARFLCDSWTCHIRGCGSNSISSRSILRTSTYVRGSDQYPRLIETSGAGEVCGPDIHGIDHPGDRRQIQWWTRRMCGWFIHLIVDGVESGWPLVRCPRATRRNLNDISERKKYSFVFLPFFPGFLSDIVAGSAWPLSADRRYRQSSKYTTNSNKSFFFLIF